MPKRIDFKDYSVELNECSLRFIGPKCEFPLTSVCCEWDDSVDMISVKYHNKWGCSMEFV